MKNLYRSVVASGLLLLTAWGCGDDGDARPDYSRPAQNTVVFRCSSAWGEHHTVWSAESRVGFFCEQTGSVNDPVGVAALSVGETDGLFHTHEAWGEGEHLFRIYAPYDGTNASTRLSGSLSASLVQNGGSTAHLDAEGLAWASVSASESGTPVDVRLEPVFSYLDLIVSTTAWQGWSLESVTLASADGEALAGDYTFDMATGELNFTDGVGETTLRMGGALLGAEPVHGYTMVGLGGGTSVTFDAAVVLARAGRDDIRLRGRATAAGIAAGEVTACRLEIDGYEEEIVADSSIDLSDPDGDGVQQTANCYVAGLPGQTYRFPATVMGNGAATPAVSGYAGAGQAGGIVPEALEPLSAQLLWQTDPGLIVDVKLRGGQVYFTLNGTAGGRLIEGNAVIAVYDAPDATGSVLWSWHIWVTAADLEAAVQTYELPGGYAAAGPTVVMGRNLGALKTGMWGDNDNNLALGLLYQWGRKDPFPNIDDENMGGTGALPLSRLRRTYDAQGNALTSDAATALAAGKWCFVVGKTIPRTEIARWPMCCTYLATTNNWIDGAYDDLWGNPFSNDIGAIGRKSIYDPCPPGYRVPHRYVGTAFSTDGANVTNKDAANLARWTGRYTTQAEIQAAGGNIWPSASGDVSYPLGGMLFVDKGKIVPFRTGKYVGHYQVSMPANDQKKSWRFYFDYGNTKPSDSNARYIGGSVRCMKE